MEMFELQSRSLKRQSSSAPPSKKSLSWLLVIAGAAFILTSTLILFNFLLSHKELSEELEHIQINSKEPLQDRQCEGEFCTSKSCIMTASRMLEIMDNTTDPCQDFYQYACGSYGKKRTVRYNEDYYSPVKETLDNILVNIKRLMEKPSAPDDNGALAKTKVLYAFCMNTSQRDEGSKSSLDAWFRQIKIHIDENAPAEQDLQLENYGSWRLILSELEGYQIHTILTPSFHMSESASLQQIDVGCQEVPMLPPDTYLTPSKEEHAYNIKLYEEVISNMFKILDVDTVRIKRYVEEIIRLETDLARAIKRSPKADIPALSVEHKQQLKEIWRPYFGEIGYNVEVKSTCEHNLENMMSVLNNASPQTSARYVIWRMMSQSMQYMGSKFLELHQHYLGRLPGSEYTFLSPWKECTDMVRNELGAVVAKGLFDEGYFTDEQIAEVKEMFWDLKISFSHVLRRMPFLDDVTSEIFSGKLNSLNIIIGFPSEENLTEDINTLLNGFEVNASNAYFMNIMELRRFKAQQFFRSLTSSDGGHERVISLQNNPLGTSSSYDYTSNRVSFDLGLLQPPLYITASDFPKFLKYGQAISLAHELSHAFDALGNFYDGYGNRSPNLDWWPDVVKEKFNNFTQCLIMQHWALIQNVPDPVANISDMQTLNNIISDLGAFFTTYAGLSIHLQSQGYSEKSLPGSLLTKKQIHFIQEAQLFCELREKSSLNRHDKHSMPPNIRINGGLMNTEDFGNVFNCPKGSPMNPVKKCNLLH